MNVAIMGRVDEGVAGEVMAAYSDCHKELPGAERNLDFMASRSIPIQEWAELMGRATPGGYNAFTAKKAQLLANMWEGAMVLPARESSVCVYIVSPQQGHDFWKGGELDRLAADEISLTALGLRFWWD